MWIRTFIGAGLILAASLQPASASNLTPASQCAAWRAASDGERIDATVEAIRAGTGKDIRGRGPGPHALLGCMISMFSSCVSGESRTTVSDAAAICFGLSMHAYGF